MTLSQIIYIMSMLSDEEFNTVDVEEFTQFLLNQQQTK